VLTIIRDDGSGISFRNRGCGGGMASGAPSLCEETSSVQSCFERKAYKPRISPPMKSDHRSHAISRDLYPQLSQIARL